MEAAAVIISQVHKSLVFCINFHNNKQSSIFNTFKKNSKVQKYGTKIKAQNIAAEPRTHHTTGSIRHTSKVSAFHIDTKKSRPVKKYTKNFYRGFCLEYIVKCTIRNSVLKNTKIFIKNVLTT